MYRPTACLEDRDLRMTLPGKIQNQKSLRYSPELVRGNGTTAPMTSTDRTVTARTAGNRTNTAEGRWNTPPTGPGQSPAIPPQSAERPA